MQVREVHPKAQRSTPTAGIGETVLDEARRHRRRGNAQHALGMLTRAGPPCTTRLRVEAALCAFDLGDEATVQSLVDGDADAQRVVAPLLALLRGTDPPVSRASSMVRGLSAIARAARLSSQGELDKARQRLHSIPKDVRSALDVEGHTDVLNIRRGHGNRAFGAAYRLARRAEGDAEALAALGSAIGSVPWLAEMALDRRLGLDEAATRACARSLRYHAEARSDSPAGLLARDTASVPDEYRGRLHLHRGFALIKSDPKRAERELDAALSRGEDALEVWRGRFLAARGTDRAQKSLQRLMRALDRCGAAEAVLVVAVALLGVLIGAGRFDEGVSVMKRVDEVLASLAVDGCETVRAVESYRLTLLEHQGDAEAARMVARGLIDKVPSAGIGWATLIALEDDADVANDLLRRGRAAVEAGGAGPRKQQDLEMLEEEASHFRARRGAIATASEWARAYLGAPDQEGAPNATLTAARDALDANHRRAAFLVEAARRAHGADTGFTEWLGRLLAGPDATLATGVAEVVGSIAPGALRKASCGLPPERVVLIASSVGGHVAQLLLLEHGHWLARDARIQIERAALAGGGARRTREAERLLEPQVSLIELIERGDAYSPPDPRLDELGPELDFMQVLPSDRHAFVLDQLKALASGNVDDEHLAVLRALAKQVARAAEARGARHMLPPALAALAGLPPASMGDEDGEIGRERDDADSRPAPFSADLAGLLGADFLAGPVKPPPAAAQRAKNKAKRKQQRRDRKRQRRKKK